MHHGRENLAAIALESEKVSAGRMRVHLTNKTHFATAQGTR
jgi:hypothetical protein